MPITQPVPAPQSQEPLGKVAFFDRELSWLAFNRRVLDLARNPEEPLLERLKFLAIVSSNLDEFYEIRVSGLVQLAEQGAVQPVAGGVSPKEVLRSIHSVASEMVSDQYLCLREDILPKLENEGFSMPSLSKLRPSQEEWLRRYFNERMFNALTPLGIDTGHPFPWLANKALYLFVQLRVPDTEEVRSAVVQMPSILKPIVRIDVQGESSLPLRSVAFIWAHDIARLFIEDLFPGYEVVSAGCFRVTRNSDLYIDDEEVGNLLSRVEKELHNLRRGAPVRLEVEESMDDSTVGYLLKSIGLSNEFVFRIPGPINLSRLMVLYDLIDRPDLRDKPFEPHIPAGLLRAKELFNSIPREDYLLHHPYDSYAPVTEFLFQAAVDPQVFAIKQTLYRTSTDSPIVEALKVASRNGKQVTVLVEIKARADEANNIQWARQLQDVGVHVVYGIVGLKTHCKAMLIVRQEGERLRRYAHIGTGNYNPRTARVYTDFSLLTSRDEITAEVAALFNTLTGFSRSPNFNKLMVAPYNLHARIQELILREAENAKKGLPARIMVKCNSLIEQQTIENLYRASNAGVSIDIIVRGICALVPGVPEMSANIRVRSIVGRFLEHTRVYYFENAGSTPVILSGSADWMARNFFRRIECLFPIESEPARRRIIEHYFPTLLKDESATHLAPNGAYTVPIPKKSPFKSQEAFIAEAERQRKQNLNRSIDDKSP